MGTLKTCGTQLYVPTLTPIASHVLLRQPSHTAYAAAPYLYNSAFGEATAKCSIKSEDTGWDLLPAAQQPVFGANGRLQTHLISQVKYLPPTRQPKQSL